MRPCGCERCARALVHHTPQTPKALETGVDPCPRRGETPGNLDTCISPESFTLRRYVPPLTESTRDPCPRTTQSHRSDFLLTDGAPLSPRKYVSGTAHDPASQLIVTPRVGFVRCTICRRGCRPFTPTDPRGTSTGGIPFFGATGRSPGIHQKQPHPPMASPPVTPISDLPRSGLGLGVRWSVRNPWTPRRRRGCRRRKSRRFTPLVPWVGSPRYSSTLFRFPKV